MKTLAESKKVDQPTEVTEDPSIRVLLVEDHTVNQLVASEMLTQLGCAVDVANNGIEALELLENDRFDIVFMDCQMPIMDGYEATRKIRSLEKDRNLPELPIVALTANALSGARDKCLEAGMNDYVTKPFSMSILDKVLHANLSASSSVEWTGKS